MYTLITVIKIGWMPENWECNIKLSQTSEANDSLSERIMDCESYEPVFSASIISNNKHIDSLS